MLQIGHQIWIVETDTGEDKLPLTQVFYKGSVMPRVLNIDISLTGEGNRKNCTVYAMEHETDFHAEGFATELALHGFSVELHYQDRIVEFWRKNSVVQREDKVVRDMYPIRQRY